MATEMLQYLDPYGLDETVLNIGQIKTNLEGQISDLGESIEEEMQDLPYARPDGIYPDMTVGAVIGADETAQWATRESTGSGSTTVRSVQGAAVAFNQLIDFRADSSRWIRNGQIYYSASDTAILVERAGTSSAYLYQTFPMVANHIYLQIVDALCTYGSSGTPQILWYTNVLSSSVSLTDTRTVYKSLITPTTSGENRFELRPNSADATITCYNAMLFDLTQMFGAGNEPATVAEFERMYPASYYPYSAPTLKPVQIAGIASTDAQGGELDAIEWTAQTLRAAGSVRDELTADELVTRVGVVDLGTLTWYKQVNPSDANMWRFRAALADAKIYNTTSQVIENYETALPYRKTSTNLTFSDPSPDKTMAIGGTSSETFFYAHDESYATEADFKAAMNGVLLYYELATPTTTPITPALPMTYKVQAGGSESIIVPAGEVSAAPVLTVAEPVNAGDEFARIWAAIESLGYTRNAAQLSRPVSLTDIGSIDEVQKDTTDVVEKEAAEVAEIDTVKEVQE